MIMEYQCLVDQGCRHHGISSYEPSCHQSLALTLALMSNSNKKLSIEERLSLAARAKSRRKGKKPDSPTPSRATSDLNIEAKGSESPDLVQPAGREEEIHVELAKDGPSSACELDAILPSDYRDLPAETVVDILKPYLRKHVESLAPRGQPSGSSLMKLIREKDNIIEELREEGENLSKLELRNNSTIKELRDKLKATEKSLDSKKKLLDAKSAANALLENRLEEMQSQRKELERQLDSTTSERDRATKDTEELKTEVLSKLKKSLEDAESQSAQSQLQVRRLRDQNEEISIKASLKYQTLDETSRSEITRLETKLEEMRIKLYQFSSTQPKGGAVENSASGSKLLSKYNALENQLKASRGNWSSIESSFRQRTYELEAKLESTQRALDAAEEALGAAKKNQTSLKSAISFYKAEKSSLEKEVSRLTDITQSLEIDLRNVREDLKLWQEKYRIQKLELEEHLVKPKKPLDSPREDNQKARPERPSNGEQKIERISDWEIQDIENLQESFENENETSGLGSQYSLGEFSQNEEIEFSSSLRKSSLASLDLTPSQQQKTVVKPSQNSQMNAQMVSRLGSQIRRLETELASLKDSNSRLLKEKQNINDTIVKLMEENSNANKTKSQLKESLAHSDALEKKLNATLQLLGERSERVEELENDVDDLKELMQMQVQQMVELQERVR
ncbi:Sgm1p [Lachancea thermotolerans CBS 6340]|uniref:KLTH0D17688p n=1 Tax=Lachancea thermotolerans (strain ATCC 56472 / CBS 6340 / NRRL Y-8284) TaxID=559295 RepID=C5DFT1_LACTC|nr:KLTH0D17688p [Lachancea thermotolerans CBS 6340]CAR23036.1 KLTH0D17688p [Lachancea thermotolerans CBS 6340]